MGHDKPTGGKQMFIYNLLQIAVNLSWVVNGRQHFQDNLQIQSIIKLSS